MRKYLLAVVFIFFSLNAFAITASADTVHLRRHLHSLITSEAFRTHQNLNALNAAADYIKSEFSKLPGQVQEQNYSIAGKTYRNIVLSTGPMDAPRLIVGAHYDVCGDQPGADDNASGVAGMLELASLLQHQQLPFRIDFVAYTLEEPPYFRSEYMGSYIHAQSLHNGQANVMGMISLEMIGYFSDQKNSQDYPVAPMKLIYGSKGNYIAVVQKFGNGKFGRKFKRLYKSEAPLRVKSLKAPSIVPGIDFSDHLNYWRFGYSALMLTDTSFYRNKNYHQPTDTINTLDLVRMGQVIDGVYKTILLLK